MDSYDIAQKAILSINKLKYPDYKSAYVKPERKDYKNNESYGKDLDYWEELVRIESANKEEERKLYNKQVAEIENEFMLELFEYFDVQNNPKRNKCYEKAWERGHSYGYQEVANVFADLVELIY